MTMWAWCCHLSASTTSTCTLTSSTTPTCISGSTCSLDTTPLASSPVQVQLLLSVFCPHPSHASPCQCGQPYLLCCYASPCIPAVCTVHDSVQLSSPPLSPSAAVHATSNPCLVLCAFKRACYVPLSSGPHTFPAAANKAITAQVPTFW